MRVDISYVIVSPVRDEAAHIEQTLESVVRQTCRPLRWMIVDDGSTDGTGELLNRFASRHEWVTVLHRADRGSRIAGGGVVQAFYDGLARVEEKNWDFLVKLDGDLSFDANYFEHCFAHFVSQPRLGIGSGTVCIATASGLSVESTGDPLFHVRGPSKIYRRDCFEQIGPLVLGPGWDTLDDVRANFLGWETRSFPELHVIHHKPTGSAYGAWHDAFKRGVANYNSGYHPAFMLAKCAKRLTRRPYVVEAVGLGAGFLSGYLKGRPRLADRETINFLRRQQLRRLTLRPSIYR